MNRTALGIVISVAVAACGSAATGGADSGTHASAGDGATCDPSPPSCVPIGRSCPGGSASCCQTGADVPVGAGCVAATGTCVPRCNSGADCAAGSCCIHNGSSVPPAGLPPGEPGGWCLPEATVAARGFTCMGGYGNGYVCEGTYVCGYGCSPADGGGAAAREAGTAEAGATEAGSNVDSAAGGDAGQSLYGTWILPFTNSSGGAAEYVFIFNTDGTCEGWLLGVSSSTTAAEQFWSGTCIITASTVAFNVTMASCPTWPPSVEGYVFTGQTVVLTNESTGQASAPLEPLPSGSVTLGTGLTITTGCLNNGVFTAEAVARVN